MKLFGRSKEIKGPKFSDEFLLKQYEASLRTQGMHSEASQILSIIAKLKAGEALDLPLTACPFCGKEADEATLNTLIRGLQTYNRIGRDGALEPPKLRDCTCVECWEEQGRGHD